MNYDEMFQKFINIERITRAKFNLKGYNKYYAEPYKRHGNLLDLITDNPDEMNFTSASMLYRLVGYK